jgi:apolipoprotein D and lipocalin family protein
MKLFARINLSSVALRRGILVSYLALAAGCASTLKVDNAPVAALDLSRYLGEWYEIARFDHSFERGVEQAKANYTQNADGTIEVVNTSLRSATAWLRHR